LYPHPVTDFGVKIELMVLIAPGGRHKKMHPDGERAT
jgi:hypothetical protein